MNKISFLEKAKKAWGSAIPDWVIILAEEVGVTGVTRAAKKIGYSPAVISTVLINAYKGDLNRVGAKVRGALMASTVRCPYLKLDIGLDQCLDNQKRPFSVSSGWRAGLYRYCRNGNCPHSRINEGSSKGGRPSSKGDHEC